MFKSLRGPGTEHTIKIKGDSQGTFHKSSDNQAVEFKVDFIENFAKRTSGTRIKNRCVLKNTKNHKNRLLKGTFHKSSDNAGCKV